MGNRIMRTLLSKTRIKFITCMTIVFMFSVPLFYLITKNFYAEDMMHIIESVEQGKGIPAIDLEQDIIAGIMFFLLSVSRSILLFVLLLVIYGILSMILYVKLNCLILCKVRFLILLKQIFMSLNV